MLPDEIIEQLADRLQGTCKSVDQALERLLEEKGLADTPCDVNVVEDSLLDYTVERCQGCEWWFESCELICEHDVAGYCDDCRKCEECRADIA